jgi:hypothetical protein
LRPGETLQYIITDAEATFPDDRVRAWTLWEGWRGYDVKKYQEALREAFEPFEHFAAPRKSRQSPSPGGEDLQNRTTTSRSELAQRSTHRL